MAEQTIKQTAIRVSPPNIRTAEFHVQGTAPYVQNRFSAKAMQKMKETQEAGQQARGRPQAICTKMDPRRTLLARS